MDQATPLQPFSARGVNGQLEVTPTRIIISRSRWRASPGRGEKAILLQHISAIQFKKAGLLTRGFIRISFLGGQESKSGSTVHAARDENAVVFTRTQQADFLLVKELIEEYQAVLLATPPASALGLDILERLADLQAKGIITREEFEAKKQQILGL